MNYSIVKYILGWVLRLESICMIFPLVTALIYQESSGVAFLITIAICATLGYLLSMKKPKNTSFRMRDGFATVALSWIILSIMGALPFIISGEIPLFHDALFETISGFTTTGASVVKDVDSLSKCMIFWRSFTHWIGGMGVLVFVLAILPSENRSTGNTMHLMRAESPGPSVGKLVPRIKSTAKILYGIYIAMTILLILLLIIGGMPIFDSLTMALGTAGTGGFSISSAGAGAYAPHLQIILTIFMILFGINFNLYYLLLLKKVKDFLKSEELRFYLGIIFLAIIFITFNIIDQVGDLATALLQSSFQVGSIITTTGYATTDFNLWPQFSKMILLLLMFVGACAGSTGGGFKVPRLVILIKSSFIHLRSFVHPRSVKVVKLDDKIVDKDTISSVSAYLVIYLVIMIVSVIIISFDKFDFLSNFSAVNATFNNIGPALGEAGPMSSYANFSVLSKLTLSFDMLAGRLELIPMLLLFSPSVWKRQKSSKHNV
ncbi:trk system potassium uptake protein TrkH [Breznakia sp. PF5-3]|uniref:TrkH family potassium uptake protein n=1 Tax=unclassified Breznakia TaxID=2623764 RepID=UPI002405096D|nr:MULTISPECIES: TrkH family potassium uptake protein [unclassified Breznakia]MDL2276103.1 TrkH family potassium uptake protein [Breznakia sp. OttesenSCG-928-G09]MDF9823873.1 trk system potassium uptake protein TrkH [Breznakia sp. PM6-1]MDF9834672.1 trk system potassium uptake protein TrkH [Breznakia sp. PF5-3]MDF9836893.1 trk system potassium uptake protein TrkH [Breznakia sp. PFB2-8]MDF9858910.1 trk system potassium uptake protein TrkH [Breznakia sp. PH5-24]